MDEIRQCAQKNINNRMANDSLFTPQQMMLSGNRGFVPAWFSEALPSKQIPRVPSTGVVNAVPQTTRGQGQLAVPPLAVTGAQALP
jgi:hypothetical protein